MKIHLPRFYKPLVIKSRIPAFFLFSKWEQYKRKSNIKMLKKRGIQLSYGKINKSVSDEHE